MSSTRAKGTDSCPRPPLPGVCSGGTALHPRKPPFPKLQGQEGQGVACGTEGRGGEDPSCIPMKAGSPPSTAAPGAGQAPRPAPTCPLQPSYAQQAAPQRPHRSQREDTREDVHTPTERPTAFQVERGAGGQGTGFGIESQT